MELCQEMAITVDKPLTVTHENSKLYASLKQCMQNNQELRLALLEAAETIDKLTKVLNESRTTTT